MNTSSSLILIYIFIALLCTPQVPDAAPVTVTTRGSTEPPPTISLLEALGEKVLARLQNIKMLLAEQDGRVDEYLETVRETEGRQRSITATTADLEAFLIDGDMIISDPNMARKMYGSSESRQKRGTVNYELDPEALWGPRIPYFISKEGMSQWHSLRIKEGLAVWESKTCIRFHEINDNEIYNVNETTLGFTNLLPICASPVGRVKDSLYQAIWLGPHCFWELGSITHEIAHTLGLWHEHSRPDRDDYVNVNYEKIVGDYKPDALRKLTEEVDDTMGLDYDFMSNMHYRSTIFGEDTLVPIDTDYKQSIGQRVGPSFLDFKKINMAICKDWCDPSELRSACLNGGYQDRNDCTQCLCPNGFGKPYCRDLQEDIEIVSCGRKYLSAYNDARPLFSPNYFGSGFPQGQECTWKITALSRSHHVKAWFAGYFNVYCSYRSVSAHHYVEVRYKDLSRDGPRYCGDQAPSSVFVSQGDSMMVLLNASFPFVLVDRKFSLYYTSGEEVHSPITSSHTATRPNNWPIVSPMQRTVSAFKMAKIAADHENPQCIATPQSSVQGWYAFLT